MRSFAVLLSALCAAVPQLAHGHLLPKQNATMRVVGNSAFIVVSVPASALNDVDDNGDGQLSVAEIRAHQTDIARQFELGFDVEDRQNPIVKRGSWVTLPDTDESHGDNDYVVVVHRIDFAAKPAYPTVTINLFGQLKAETQYSFRASRGGVIEQAMLARGSPGFTFFTTE